ncbi:putative uncharacterized protein DDB_G0271982 [Ylistrum balloti]|uniref:putative uncharacterized protein DDB_G0271982 n=1 Tax=Ylistrum balloti TaxID=509963 RepID=UPI0029057F68|nr:putative uncharacterized protein DDB_G0271982 [Ylistrum balloti]
MWKQGGNCGSKEETVEARRKLEARRKMWKQKGRKCGSKEENVEAKDHIHSSKRTSQDQRSSKQNSPIATPGDTQSGINKVEMKRKFRREERQLRSQQKIQSGPSAIHTDEFTCGRSRRIFKDWPTRTQANSRITETEKQNREKETEIEALRDRLAEIETNKEIEKEAETQGKTEKQRQRNLGTGRQIGRDRDKRRDRQRGRNIGTDRETETKKLKDMEADWQR